MNTSTCGGCDGMGSSGGMSVSDILNGTGPSVSINSNGADCINCGGLGFTPDSIPADSMDMYD